MVEQSYVRKRKRKKAAAIVTSVCAGIATVFMIVAFVGYRVGSFTVKLRETKVKLALTQDKPSATDGKTESEGTDTTHNTTYLLISSLPAFELDSDYNLQDHDRYDSTDTDYLEGGYINPKTSQLEFLYFFKYTFYLKNVGQLPARYDFNLRIRENKRPSNVSYSYDDILRVRLYENMGDTHEYKTFAKAPVSGTEGHIDEDGNLQYQELIWSGGTEYATNFISETVITETSKNEFLPGDYVRYTVLMWLEGTDPQCRNQPPRGGSIKLEIGITASDQNSTDEN